MKQIKLVWGCRKVEKRKNGLHQTCGRLLRKDAEEEDAEEEDK